MSAEPVVSMREESQNEDLNNYDEDWSVSNEERDENELKNSSQKFKKYIKK